MATMQAANNTTAFPNGDVHIDPPNSSAMKCTGKWRNVKSLIARCGFIIHAVGLVVWALMRVGGPKGEFQENLETYWWLAVWRRPSSHASSASSYTRAKENCLDLNGKFPYSPSNAEATFVRSTRSTQAFSKFPGFGIICIGQN